MEYSGEDGSMGVGIAMLEQDQEILTLAHHEGF